MKALRISRVAPLAAAMALTACGESDPRSEPSPAPTAVASKPAPPPSEAALPNEAASQAEFMEQEREARAAHATADPAAGIIDRAETCIHFAGEEPYDDARRAEINKAITDSKCDTVVAEADALKAKRPQDAARLDTAVADLRP